MCVCVCLCVCVCVCVCVCTRACVCVCACVYSRVWEALSAYACMLYHQMHYVICVISTLLMVKPGKLVHCPVSKIWPSVIRLLQSTITCLLHCMYGFTSVVPIVAVANSWGMICLLFPLDYLCIGKNW